MFGEQLLGMSLICGNCKSDSVSINEASLTGINVFVYYSIGGESAEMLFKAFEI